MIDMRGIDRLPSGAYRIRVQHMGEVLSGTAPTLEIAVQLRDELKRQIIDGSLVPTKGQTARMVGPRFLGSRATNRDADSDASRWHRHIATAAWATKPLQTVTRADGVAWLKALKRKRMTWEPEQGGRRSEALSWQSRKHCLNLSRRFFAWALATDLVTANPFLELMVEREDGDEDDGYQDTWYLDADEQRSFLACWEDLDERRVERWIVQFAIGTGLRMNEQWCLHLADVHVDGHDPHIIVRFGSWDRKKRRYLSPKGRKGEKRSRRVPLFGLALDAARAWLAELPAYAPKNPLGLMFPTERGARRDKPPRSWKTACEAFGSIPRIGRGPWWHLLRHTAASSMVSGWWGMRWSLEDVSAVLGHTDVRTTQMYAHLAPSAVNATATRAQAAYAAAGGRHAAVTVLRPPARKVAESEGHARRDSNPRHSASKAGETRSHADELARHDGLVTAIRHVLQEIAEQRLPASSEVVSWLEVALDRALSDYADAVEGAASR